MKILFAIILITIVVVSCKVENPYEKYFNSSWGTKNDTIIKNGWIFTQDTVQRLKILDSTVIFYVNRFIDKDLTIKALVLDTLIFDFQIFHGITYLILFKNLGTTNKGLPYSVSFVLRSKIKEPIKIQETNHLKQTPISIEGYTIGDSIDRNLFHDLENTSYYSYSYYSNIRVITANYYESGHLKPCCDISMELIGGKYLTYLTRFNIPTIDIDDLVSSITYKLGFKPIYVEDKIIKKQRRTNDMTYTSEVSYKWYINGLYISLEDFYHQNNWVLYYTNFIVVEALRDKFADIPPNSKYIK